MLKRALLFLLFVPVLIASCNKGDSGNEFAINGVRDVNLGTIGMSALSLSIEQTSGTVQPVAITVSGLPNGVTADIQPASGTPPYTCTITFRQTGFLPGGTHTIKVTGTSSSFTKSYDVRLTIPLFNGFMVDNILYTSSSMSHSTNAGSSGFTIVSTEGGGQSVSGYFWGNWPAVDGTYTYDVGPASSTSMLLTYYPNIGVPMTSDATGKKATVVISGGKLSLSVTGVQISQDTLVRSLSIGAHE